MSRKLARKKRAKSYRQIPTEQLVPFAFSSSAPPETKIESGGPDFVSAQLVAFLNINRAPGAYGFMCYLIMIMQLLIMSPHTESGYVHQRAVKAPLFIT